MTEEEKISRIVHAIKENKLSWLVSFLIHSHLPLRGILSQGIQSFDPLLKALLGAENADSLKWIFETNERMDFFIQRLESK